jgi:uncharacterized protein YkwD
MKIKYSFNIILLFLLTNCNKDSPVSLENSVTSPEFTQQVIELTNLERVNQDLSPLKFQVNLHNASEWMANDMADYNYMGHTDHMGGNIASRIPGFGYSNYSIIGENVAAGYTTPEKVIEGWMNSPGHRANILNSDFSEIGAGYNYNKSSEYGHFWVQDFGSRFNIFPLVINNEASETKSREVDLYLYGSGWAEQMRISNDSTNWTALETFKTHRRWSLASGQGDRTVFVELYKGGEIRNSKDSIMLIQNIQ